MDDLNLTAEELRDFRRVLGWSQQKLADELAVARNTVNRMEQGHMAIERRTALAVRYLAWHYNKIEKVTNRETVQQHREPAGDAHKQVDLPLAPLDSELSHTQIDGWHPITELPEPGRRIDVWSVEDGYGNCVYDLGATHYIADSIRSAHWVKKVTAWRYSTPVLAPLFPRF